MSTSLPLILCFLFIASAPTEIYTLSLHDALPISEWDLCESSFGVCGDPHPPPNRKTCATEATRRASRCASKMLSTSSIAALVRSEEHTSELQSLTNLVCRLLLEKKNKKNKRNATN